MFITADSIVPDPFDPQALNRYSYCRNNPLTYVDPSGHNPLVIGAIFGAVIGGVSAGINSDWDTGAMLQGAAMGAVTGAISGGAFHVAGQAIQAGVWTCPLTGISVQTLNPFQQALIHVAAGAISGGINAGISGDDVGFGALSGGLSAGMAKYAGASGMLGSKSLSMKSFVGRTIIGGVSSGIAAEIYGGDFGNGFASGAQTAIYAYVFNESMAHSGRWRRYIFEVIPGIESWFMAGDYRDQMVSKFEQEHSMRSAIALTVTEKEVANVWLHWAKGYTRMHAFFHSYAWTVDQNFVRYLTKT